MSDQGFTDAEPAAEPSEAEDRTMESRPRRVVLRRDENGSYCIFMGSRMIQGFCSEFEDVTGYSIGMNRQQQVRICIEPIGRQIHARYPEREDVPQMVRHRDPGEAVMIRTTDRGLEPEDVALFSSAHPQGIERWPDMARRGLQEQMTRLQDMLNLLEGM